MCCSERINFFLDECRSVRYIPVITRFFTLNTVIVLDYVLDKTITNLKQCIFGETQKKKKKTHMKFSLLPLPHEKSREDYQTQKAHGTLT